MDSFACEAKALVGERQQQCHRLSKIRPRASRSSSHRDERWEGCRVWRGLLGKEFSWTRTALNLRL